MDCELQLCYIFTTPTSIPTDPTMTIVQYTATCHTRTVYSSSSHCRIASVTYALRPSSARLNASPFRVHNACSPSSAALRAA